MSSEHEIDPTLHAAAEMLERLDVRLRGAVAVLAGPGGQESSWNAYRGLYVTDTDVADVLVAQPFSPRIPPRATSDVLLDLVDAPPAIASLAKDLGLTQFDLDVIAVAAAVDLDLRYERVFAYLHDDVTRRRPTVALTIDLLATSPAEHLTRRAYFAPDSPLLRAGVLRLLPDARSPEPPILARAVRLDPQYVRAFAGGRGLDDRLAACCELVQPSVSIDDVVATDATRRILEAVAKPLDGRSEPLWVNLIGPPGSGRRKAAEAVASARDAVLLVADVSHRASRDEDHIELLTLVGREARLLGAVLLVEGAEALGVDDDDRAIQALIHGLTGRGEVVVLATTEPWRPPPPSHGRPSVGVVDVRLDRLSAGLRRTTWAGELERRRIPLGEEDLDRLAERFLLTPGQIADAVATAAARLKVQPGATDALPPADGPVEAVFGSARAQTGHELGKLAHRLPSLHQWTDLVLPDDVLARLQEICVWVTQREKVLHQWGFARHLLRGSGIPCLFAGPPGTGKTMAVEVIGRSVGLDVFVVDLSGVVSKWLGETEKNLDRIFAQTTNAILCFDEADALFGKRSEVSDAHDRYANIEISYLLQRMESHDGLTILTTNMLENIDEAFLRRLAFVVHFPFPETRERARLWKQAWPAETPLDMDIDIDHLAHVFHLAGGNIKNAALSAAYLAAGSESPVGMAHVLHAVEREFQKMGSSSPDVSHE